MHKVIYTKSLDNADEVEASAEEFEDINQARAAFDQIVKKLMYNALDNEYLKCKMSIHNHKALVQIEGQHHCVVLQKG